MFLWFAGASFAFVWLVFRSPALDYRLVMLGSVLPIGEVVLGGPRVLHTLLATVALLAVVMLATQQRRLVRRRIISLPIGMMMHLVLDGIWTRAEVFWWPFFGFAFPEGGLPEFERPVGVALVLELAGIACLVWCWKTFDFSDRANLDRFVRTGHLPRDPHERTGG
jgi:hypothetical protein